MTTNTTASIDMDNEIEELAMKHIAVGWAQAVAINGHNPDYRKTAQFHRLKAFAVDLLARRSTSGSDGTAAAGAGGLPPYEVVVALNSLRWMLNKSDQCDKPNMRATTLLDKHHSKDGKTIRQNLETLWRYFDTNRPEMTALLLSGGDRQAATSGSELAPDADLDYLLEYITVSAAHSAAQRKVAELRALAQQAATCQPLADERAKIVKEIATTLQRQLETASASAAERNENALAGLLSALSSQAHLILAVEGRFERRAALAHQSPSIDQQGGALDDAIRKSAILVNGIWYVPMHAIAHRPIAPANLPEVLPEDVLRYAMECSGRNNPDGARLVRTIYHFIRECLTAPSPSAEDDQDAKDADRYRWLLEDPANVTWGDFYDRTSHGPNWSVSDAIDAAMSQAKGAGKEGGAE